MLLKSFNFFLSCLLLLLQFNITYAQQPAIDSMLQLLKTCKGDTNEVKILNELSWELKNSNPDSAILISTNALNISRTLDWERGVAVSYNRLGVACRIKGNYALSSQYYLQALELFQKMKDDKVLENKN